MKDSVSFGDLVKLFGSTKQANEHISTAVEAAVHAMKKSNAPAAAVPAGPTAAPSTP